MLIFEGDGQCSEGLRDAVAPDAQERFNTTFSLIVCCLASLRFSMTSLELSVPPMCVAML